jgi:hypothetical protein
VLALTLLLAQVSALAHGYSHLRAQGEVVGGGTTAGQICPECLSSTSLLTAAGAPDSLVIFHPPGATEVVHSRSASLIELRPTRAFRSRAPPFLV